jgi:uncharacterized membrane protein YfcA
MNEPGALALACGVVTFAATVQLATGFGFALVCVPLLVLFLDPHVAVLIALQIGILGALYQAVEGRRHMNRGVVTRLTAAAFVGLPVGGLVYARSSPRVLTIVVGVVTLVTVALLARGLTFKRTSPPLDIVAGLLTGVLTTSTGTSGPPIVTVLQARKVAPPEFRATTSVVFCVLDTAAIAAFAVAGRLTLPLFLATLGTLPGLGIGAWVGTKVRRLLSPAAFRIVVLALLSWSGLAAILSALT